jgi:aminopeptidase-like protein
MEQSVNLSETRLRFEVNNAEEKINDFKGEILNELRQSEQRMQEMMLQSMNDLLRSLVGEEEEI